MSDIETVIRSMVATVDEFGQILNPPISRRRVEELCHQGRIPEAFRLGHIWLIPRTAADPRQLKYANKHRKAKR